MILGMAVVKAISALDKKLSKPGVDYAARRAESGRYDSTGSRYVSSAQRMGDAPGAAGGSAKASTPVASSDSQASVTPDNNYRHLVGGVKGGSSSGNTGTRGTPTGSVGSARMANGLPDTSANNKAGRMAGWSQPVSRRGSGGMSGI